MRTGRAGRWSRCGVVLEGEGDLVAQPSERYLAHPPDHGVNLAVAGAGGLDGEGDQQAEEVGMAFERLHGGHDDPAQMVASTSDSAIRIGQVGEEPLRAALHDGEKDSVLRPEVVVDGAQRHAGFLDDAGDRRRFEAVRGHDSLGRIEHERAALHAASVRGHGHLADHASPS